MSDKLSQSAQNVQNVLTGFGVSCTVVEMPDTTRTAKEAAAAIGCTVAQIAKSIIFRTASGNQPILDATYHSHRVPEVFDHVLQSHHIKRLQGELNLFEWTG